MRLQEPVMLQPVATRKHATAARLADIDRMGWFPPDQAGCDRLKPLQSAMPDVANLHLSVRLQYLPGLVDVKSAQRLSGACSAFMLLEYPNPRHGVRGSSDTMPIYEYCCQSCRHEFEELVRSMTRDAAVRCPDCGSETVERKLSVFAPHAGSRSSATAPHVPIGGCGRCGDPNGPCSL